MIKIKKNTKDYDNILFMTDPHWGHNKEFVWGARGFKSDVEHNDWLQDQIDSLSPDSLLVMLGDMGLSVGAERIQEFMMTFPCETLAIFGNHNSGVYQLYQQHLPKGFEKCQLYPLRITPNITLLGYEFLLDIGPDRYYCRHMAPLIWPEVNTGRQCLIGHSYSNLIPANPGENGLGKILDVGVDNAIKYNGTAFFSLEEVRKIMSNKQFNTIDHHV